MKGVTEREGNEIRLRRVSVCFCVKETVIGQLPASRFTAE